jgi:hypothetical protein
LLDCVYRLPLSWFGWHTNVRMVVIVNIDKGLNAPRMP